MNMALALLLASALSQAPAPVAAPAPIAMTAPQFFAVSVPDAAASSQWYQDVLGLKVIREIKPVDAQVHVFILGSDSLHVEVLQMKGARPVAEVVPGANGEFMVHGVFKAGFFVPSLEPVVAALKAKGVTFAFDITQDQTGVRFAIFKDNSGNLIQIFDRPQPKG